MQISQLFTAFIVLGQLKALTYVVKIAVGVEGGRN
ncbi:hypothetical protein LCGC14_2646470, partial [marine sediment metagenome]